MPPSDAGCPEKARWLWVRSSAALTASLVSYCGPPSPVLWRYWHPGGPRTGSSVYVLVGFVPLVGSSALVCSRVSVSWGSGGLGSTGIRLGCVWLDVSRAGGWVVWFRVECGAGLWVQVSALRVVLALGFKQVRLSCVWCWTCWWGWCLVAFSRPWSVGSWGLVSGVLVPRSVVGSA